MNGTGKIDWTEASAEVNHPAVSEPARSEFDPVTLEIYWSRLISIADEAAAGLLRAAFSTIVRESNDFGTVLMDEKGDSVSENTGGIASFSCILPRTAKAFLGRFPAESWRPGDTVITNDPWLATGHLPDFTAVTPIFHRGRLVGFAGSIAHSPDVGGALWSADCQELFEEGIRIPPAHLLRAGEWNAELLDLLLANVRVPGQVLGDLKAQVVANEVCVRRVEEFLEDTGLEDLQALVGGGAAPRGKRDAAGDPRGAGRRLPRDDRGRRLRRNAGPHRLCGRRCGARRCISTMRAPRLRWIAGSTASSTTRTPIPSIRSNARSTRWCRGTKARTGRSR